MLVSCATSIVDTAGQSSELTAASYANGRNTKGIVLLDVNWGRRWSCGGYENAELRGLSFDRMPPLKSSDDVAADLTLQEPASLTSRPIFISYALLVEPGEYALSGFNIKVARSVSDVGYWVAKRSDLLKDGKILGGNFKVGEGETVYIGNFFLDCHQRPQPWRYYTEGADNFKLHLAQYKKKYPFLDTGRVKYRLFETSSLGRSYELK
jgi:hypothetical protein